MILNFQSFIDGLLLSDGSIEQQSNVSGRLSVCQSEDHKDWLYDIQNVLEKYGIKSNVTKRKTLPKNLFIKKIECTPQWRYDLRTLSSPYFLEQKKRWYPSSKKSVPRDIDFSPEMFAYWYMGDGSLVKNLSRKNTYSLKFCTQSFTDRDVNFLADGIKIYYEFEPKQYHRRGENGADIRLLRRDDVDEMLSIMYPYRSHCFDYKWKKNGGN